MYVKHWDRKLQKQFEENGPTQYFYLIRPAHNEEQMIQELR